MNDQTVHLLKLTTGEEVMCKLVEKEDSYEIIEAVSFRWGLEYDKDLGRNVERLQPSSFPVNASLGRYEIKKENVMLSAPPRPEALTVYHGFVASVLNYSSNQPNPNS
tara:strand:+ start:1397 stop:1720 length:324 start_codon:yes stop_codon:yes gene_type:complete